MPYTRDDIKVTATLDNSRSSRSWRRQVRWVDPVGLPYMGQKPPTLPTPPQRYTIHLRAPDKSVIAWQSGVFATKRDAINKGELDADQNWQDYLERWEAGVAAQAAKLEALFNKVGFHPDQGRDYSTAEVEAMLRKALTKVPFTKLREVR